MEAQMSAPLLTQVRPAYFSVDCGMSYVMRLSDGRFVIIDGNVGEYDEAEHLYSVLRSQTDGAKEPTVAAWFITHPHGDHFGGFTEFCKLYRDRVKIEKVLYHFPTPGIFSSEGSDKTEFLRVLGELDTEIITPRTGDIFDFSDAHFEVIFCCEDLYPGPVKNINDSSFVMTMTLGNYKVLWLGDLQREGSDCICAKVDKKKLKCDILQVGHHGYGGGSDELYRAADPSILLWPCPDFWFHPVRLWACNDYLINSENIRATFVGGQAENVFDMTKPIEYTDPYTESKVRADFSKKSILALGWSCLTGGKTGYAPAKLVFTDNGCRLETEDALTLCQIIQRGQTAKSDSYSFDFSGEAKKAELFGLIFDYTDPMTWSDSAVVPLPTVGAFSYRLEVSKKERSASLYSDGVKIKEWKDICPDPCDIILVMKNAEISLIRTEYNG